MFLRCQRPECKKMSLEVRFTEVTEVTYGNDYNFHLVDQHFCDAVIFAVVHSKKLIDEYIGLQIIIIRFTLERFEFFVDDLEIKGTRNM